MPKGILFWVLWLFCVIFGLWCYWPVSGGPWYPLGGNLVVFILLGILGWNQFGPPIQ